MSILISLNYNNPNFLYSLFNLIHVFPELFLTFFLTSYLWSIYINYVQNLFPITFTTITLSFFLITSTTVSFISVSNITSTPFLILVFPEYTINLSPIFLAFSPFHFVSCKQQIFTFLLLKTSANYLLLPANYSYIPPTYSHFEPILRIWE